MAERSLPLTLCTTFELLQQRLPRIEIGKQVLSILAPEDSSMLHASARDTLHLREVRTLLLQSLEHEVDSLEEQSYRRKHLTLGRVCEHTLLNAIFGTKVCVKVYFGFLEKLEVGADDNSYVPAVR